jgi:hypothetical protein
LDNPNLTIQEIQWIRIQRRIKHRLNREFNPRVRFFSNLFREKNLFPLIGAEIGVNYGEYTYRLLQEIRDDVDMMYCVDPYKVYGDRQGWKKQQWEQLYVQTVHRFSSYDNVTIVRATSERGAWVVPDCLGYVFIDGDHSYHSVTEDIHFWEEKIVDGGILSGHDYNFKKYFSVTEAVNDYAKRYGREIHNPVGGCFYWEVHR